LRCQHHNALTIKNTAIQHAYIGHPLARCAFRSGTLAQLAGGSLRLCAGLQPAALIAASTQPVGIAFQIKISGKKGISEIGILDRKAKKKIKVKKAG